MLGKLLNGKYRLESAFSESRMYEVFTAIEEATGASVVVKLMKPEIIENHGIVNRFCEEVKSFAGLSHPLIAEVLDVDMYEKRPYMVSPLVKGVPLNEYMYDSVLPWNECLDIIKDLGTILSFAASQKVDCRIIKLSNVLRTEDKSLKLLSFTHPRLKTLSSLSVKSETSGLYADLYFLGITLYELLAGESPIRVRGGLYELWDMKLQKALRIRHMELTPEQIDNTVEFIRKTIARDAKDKFADHEDYLKALDELSGKQQPAVKKRKARKRQLCIASQVVDALNGVSNVLPSFTVLPSGKMVSKKAEVASASVNSNSNSADSNNSDVALGTADFKTEGTLALAVDNSEKFDEISKEKTISEKTHRPALRLVKPHARDAFSERVKRPVHEEESSMAWKEDNSGLRSPVFFGGLVLIIMVALILFW